MWWIWAASALPMAGVAVLAPRVAHPRAAAVIVLLGAIAMRALLLPWHPALSDDYFRYLWDGRVLAAGMNPYGRAPLDPAFAALRDAWWPGINHKTIPTIYPPLAIVLAAGTRAVGDGVLPLKAALILLDLGVVATSIRLLHRHGGSPAWAALYAWHPLPLAEVAGAVHLEPLAVWPTMLAVVALTPPVRRGLRAGLWLGVSAIGKLGGVLLLPAVARRAGRPAVWACVLVLAAATLPFAGAGPRMGAALVRYAGTWEFNGALFDLCAWLLRDHTLARVPVALALAVVLWRSARSDAPLSEIAFGVFTATFLLAPTVYPWYLLWPLPFAVVTVARTRRPAAWAVLVWGWTAMLSYAVLGAYRARGVWQLPLWAECAEYAPVVLLLAADRGVRAALRPARRAA